MNFSDKSIARSQHRFKYKFLRKKQSVHLSEKFMVSEEYQQGF